MRIISCQTTPGVMEEKSRLCPMVACAVGDASPTKLVLVLCELFKERPFTVRFLPPTPPGGFSSDRGGSEGRLRAKVHKPVLCRMKCLRLSVKPLMLSAEEALFKC